MGVGAGHDQVDSRLPRQIHACLLADQPLAVNRARDCNEWRRVKRVGRCERSKLVGAFDIPVQTAIVVHAARAMEVARLVPIESGSLSEEARSNRVPPLPTRSLSEGGILAVEPQVIEVETETFAGRN